MRRASADQLLGYVAAQAFGPLRGFVLDFWHGEASMRFEHAKASDIPAGVWQWPHFDASREWADKASGRIVVETDFMNKLEKLRRMFGAPLIVTSGYRTPEHNAEVSTTGEAGPHTTGRAVDIRIYGAHALALVHLALGIGFTGIGLSQKGPHEKRFVHLDDLEAPKFPRPWIWTY